MTELAAWELRYRATRISLPDWADDAPHRCLYVSNASGTFELYAWDRAADAHRQVTSRPNGTTDGALPPDGEHVWWFDDSDGDEFGTWMRQSFAGGPDEPALPDVPAGYPAGLAIGRSLAVVGTSDDDGTTVYVVRPTGTSVLYTSADDAHVVDVSRDNRWVLLEHSEHGDSRHRALRVLDVDGTVVADLWDGPRLGLDGVGFAPTAASLGVV